MPTPLLAEDLLLITAHPRTGTLRRPRGLAVPRALAGAVLQDCLALNAVRLEGGRVVPTPPSVQPSLVVEHALSRLTRAPVVEQAIETLAAPRTRLGQHLLESMTRQGSVARGDARFLGVVPVAVHWVADAGAAETLRARVVAALFRPVDDAQVTALARLVVAGDLYRPLHIEAPTVRRRGRPVREDDPITVAVTGTIRRARRDAATSGAIAATVAAVAGSGG